MTERTGRVFYGWYIVAFCWIVNFVVFGIGVNTFTVYVKPIQAELEWSRGAISLAISLAAIAMGLAAPFIGRLIDRTGARLPMAAGAAVVGVCTILLSRAQSLPYFYAVFIVSGIGLGATTIIPVSLVISNWFTAMRGKALGIAMTGTGLGAMVMVPVSTWIVTNWGWRTCYAIMGCIILLMAPLCLLLIRTRPSDMGLLPDGGFAAEKDPASAEGLAAPEAVRTQAFWMIAVMMVLAGLVAMGAGVHLMPYLTDVGHTEARASLIIAVISGMTFVGKISLGSVADRWGVRPTVALAFGMILAGFLLLMGAAWTLVAFAFAIVYGFGIGAPLVVNPALTAECLGLKHFGTVFGILTLFTTGGAALGAVLTGFIYDAAGSYIPALLLFVGLTAVAGLCGVLARRAINGDVVEASAFPTVGS
jgi:MFS family permease